MYFSENLKVLRKRKKVSQDELSTELNIKRTTLSGYENGTAQANFETLLKFSAFFNVSIDALLKTDMTALSEAALNELQEETFPADVTGIKLRVLATTVNNDNEENIEMVPVKAKAGYTRGYADPDFIKILQTFNLPFLDRNKKYRSFQISGDSMPPVSNGSWVTGEFVQNWNFIKDRHPYIIVTKDDGIVFKTVFNKIRERKTLLLCSTNPLYEPYEVNINDVLEVWKFSNYISSELPEPNLSKDEVSSTLMNLQREVSELKNTFKKKSAL